MNILLNALNKSKTNKELLSFYDEKDNNNEFYIGYVSMIFNDSFLISSFDQEGEPDGYILIRYVDIYKIEKDTLHLKKFSSLYTGEKENFFENESTTNDGIDYLLLKLKSENCLLSIKLIYQDYITGFLSRFDDEFIIIEMYTNLGISNGKVIIKYEDIQSLAFGRKEEKTIFKLIKR